MLDRNVINAGPRDRRQTKIINIYRPRFARVCPIETQYSLRRPSLMQTHRGRATIAKFRPYANRANSITLITLNSPEQLCTFFFRFFIFFLFAKQLLDKLSRVIYSIEKGKDRECTVCDVHAIAFFGILFDSLLFPPILVFKSDR